MTTGMQHPSHLSPRRAAAAASLSLWCMPAVPTALQQAPGLLSHSAATLSFQPLSCWSYLRPCCCTSHCAGQAVSGQPLVAHCKRRRNVRMIEEGCMQCRCVAMSAPSGATILQYHLWLPSSRRHPQHPKASPPLARRRKCTPM